MKHDFDLSFLELALTNTITMTWLTMKLYNIFLTLSTCLRMLILFRVRLSVPMFDFSDPTLHGLCWTSLVLSTQKVSADPLQLWFVCVRLRAVDRWIRGSEAEQRENTSHCKIGYIFETDGAMEEVEEWMVCEKRIISKRNKRARVEAGGICDCRLAPLLTT